MSTKNDKIGSLTKELIDKKSRNLVNSQKPKSAGVASVKKKKKKKSGFLNIFVTIICMMVVEIQEKLIFGSP